MRYVSTNHKFTHTLHYHQLPKSTKDNLRLFTLCLSMLQVICSKIYSNGRRVDRQKVNGDFTMKNEWYTK